MANPLNIATVGSYRPRLALMPAPDILLIANGVPDAVTMTDVATLKPIKTINLVGIPWRAAILPSQNMSSE